MNTSSNPQPATSEPSGRRGRDVAGAARGLTVAYLVNQYPMPTQSFIRREIAALEQQGVTVERFTVRRWDAGTLVDPGDRAEKDRTRAILDVGAAGLLLAVLRTLLSRPVRFLRALAAALRHGKRSGRGRGVHLAYLAEACVLVGWLSRSKATHLHVHFGTNGTDVGLLCRLMGGPPYSFTCHGPAEFDRPEAIALAEKVRHCAFVAAISSFARSQLFRWCRYEDWHKVRVVRCGVDDLFLGLERTTPSPAPRLVNVGRIGRSKGQLFLIEAAARLVKEGHDDMELILVGDGDFRKDAEALIARLGLQKQVKILGWMSNEQVRAQMLDARALVLPSFGEGLPLVIMEALALGRPVLSTYIAGIPELVEPNVSGWLVPAGSIECLTDAMRQILTAPVERLRELGAAGAERVARDHSAAIEAGKLAEFFRAAHNGACEAARGSQATGGNG